MIRFIGKIEHDTKLDNGKSIVILGCGKLGKTTYENLDEENQQRVSFFCDSNKESIGMNYRGVLVKRYEDITDINETYIVANLDTRKTVLLLIEKGIDDIHISV